MKSRKLKVTAVAILSTLIFATTAFAGIFDVVGAVVGGVLGVSMQPTQEQLEKFHKDYLDKVANKIKQTGDIDGAIADVVAEQKKLGCAVSVVQNDSGQFKSMDISGGNLPCTVKCSVDRQQQLMAICYVNSDGTPVGNTLTKKYEMPGDVANSLATVDSSQSTTDVSTSEASKSPFAKAISAVNQFSNSTHKQEIEKAFNAKVQPNKSTYVMGKTYMRFPSSTGCTIFDNSLLRGNNRLMLYAYLYGASKNTDPSRLSAYTSIASREISDVCQKKDPFAFDAMVTVFKSLCEYYARGNQLDLCIYTVIDIPTPIGGTCFHINTLNEDQINRYNTRTQHLIINPDSPESACEILPPIETNCFNCDYTLAINTNVAKEAHTKIVDAIAKNKAVASNNKNGKITSFRICYVFSTPAGTINDYYALSGKTFRSHDNNMVFKNVAFKILAVDNKFGDNSNTNWYPILSASGSDCVVLH